MAVAVLVVASVDALTHPLNAAASNNVAFAALRLSVLVVGCWPALVGARSRLASWPRPVARPGAGRRTLLAVVVLVVVASGIAAPSIASCRAGHRRGQALSPAATARADARTFLHLYGAPDGRLVRWDQGSDTVSEDHSYALLLAAAIGDRPRFAAVWRWQRSHLQLPSGLFAYHWRPGRVAAAQPATDVDLDTAWALVLAGRWFGSSADRVAGLVVVAAVLAQETASVAGRLAPVAGPWARTVPTTVNLSYLSLEAMHALARAFGDPQWTPLTADSAALLGRADEIAHRAPRAMGTPG